MALNMLLIIVFVADLLLLVSGYYLYRRSQRTLYLSAIFLGLLLLILLAVLLALRVLA